MKLAGKFVVVTGAGNGIGRELTLQLLARGAWVAAVDINYLGLQQTVELAEANASKVISFVVDIANRSSVQELPDKVVEHFGGVDGLINSAGIIQPFVRVNDLAFDRIEKVFNVNFYGTLNLTKAFLPRLLMREQAHIVNISSMGGFVPFPGQVVYGASKAAVKLLTEGLDSELADSSVRVTAVFPGAVRTNITSNSGVGGPALPTETGKVPAVFGLTPQKAANIILNAVERNRKRVMVGADAKIMDLLSRIAPKTSAKLMQRVMSRLLNPQTS